MQANILVVDDTRENLRLLSNILTEQGYLVRPVPQGARAISAAQSKPPDLILLDIMMPGLDGYAVCNALKADERTRDVPVIFISALNETVDKVKAFSTGGVDFITKPFQPEEVLARVKTHVALRTAQKRLQEHNRELALLNTMSHRLQTCRTEQDTYQIVADTCRNLLPESSGYVYMCAPMQEHLESVAAWNVPPPEFREMRVESLELVYLDAADVVEHPDAGSIASRIGYSPEQRALCIPIGSSEALLAMLGVYFETEPAWEQLLEAKHGILTEVVNHYALALINVQLRETLRHEAIHDPLTGLYNRRHMEAALEREAHRAQRHQTSVGIIMFDIDHFKTFNDTYGHEAGDAVLRDIGGILKRSSRGEDMACRYGGEEFLLILPDTTPKDARTRAEHLLEQAGQHSVVYQGTTLAVTISIGVATYPLHGADIRSLVGAADAALYQAKENGRNRVVVAEASE